MFCLSSQAPFPATPLFVSCGPDIDAIGYASPFTSPPVASRSFSYLTSHYPFRGCEFPPENICPRRSFIFFPPVLVFLGFVSLLRRPACARRPFFFASPPRPPPSSVNLFRSSSLFTEWVASGYGTLLPLSKPLLPCFSPDFFFF